MSNQKLQSTDLFLTNRDAVSYKSTYGDIKANILDSHIIQSPAEPDSAVYPDMTVGTIWVNTGLTPPSLNSWSGTEWEEIDTGGGGLLPVDPDPDTDISNPPGTGGSGSKLDPFDLTNSLNPEEVLFGGSCESEAITISNMTPGNLVSFVDENSADNGTRFNQAVGFTGADGVWIGTIKFVDAPESSTPDFVYSALLKLGSSEVYYKYDVKVKSPSVEPEPTVDIDLGVGPGVTPPGVGGDGSIGDPFVFEAVTCYTAGGSVESSPPIKVLNQTAGQVFKVETTAGGTRFAQPTNTIEGDGTSTFQLQYTDTPESSSGDTHEAEFKLGNTYFKWSVVQIVNATPIVGGDGLTSAPNSSPASVEDSAENLYGTGGGTWADAEGTLRVEATSSRRARTGTYANLNALIFSVNGSAMDQTDKAVEVGDTISVAFDETAIQGVAQGERVAGALTNDAGFFQVFEMVKDGLAQPFTIDPLVDQEISTEVDSGILELQGFNVPASLTVTDGDDALTGVAVSVNGAPYTSSFPVTVNPGETVQLKGTTTSVNELEHTLYVTIGGETATWSVTTAESVATVVQPRITSPADNSSELGTSITLNSTDFAVSEGPSTHASSSWEILESGLSAAVTDTITGTSFDSVSPDAKMKGVRISEDGYFRRTADIRDVFTFSCWYRHEHPRESMTSLFRWWKDSNTEIMLTIDKDQKIGLKVNGEHKKTGMKPPSSAWHHLVLAYSNKEKTAYLTVDGDTHTLSGYTGDPWSDGQQKKLDLFSEKFNGQVSDTYLVDGKLLSAQVFGEYIEQIWAPLDSDVIDNNLAALDTQPYDARALTSQVWSTDTTVVDSDQENAFDGKLETFALGVESGNEGIGWSFDYTAIGVTSVEVYMISDSTNGQGITLNNTTIPVISSLPKSDEPQWVKAPEYALRQIEGELESIEVVCRSSCKPQVYAVKVNGRMLVDSGLWNQTSNWSGEGTLSGTTMADAEGWYKHGFDGTPTTYWSPVLPSGLGDGSQTITFADTIIASKVEILAQRSSVAVEIKVNGVSTLVPANDSIGWINVTAQTTAAGGLTSITTEAVAAAYTRIYSIKVDDMLLVDAGDTWETSENWSSNNVGPHKDIVNNNIGDAFDGKIDTSFIQGDGDFSVKFADGAAYTTSVRVLAYKEAGASNDSIKIIINGSEVAIGNQVPDSTEKTPEWVTVTGIAADGKVTGFAFKAGASDPKASLHMLEVDKKPVVDKGGVGSLGFYLDMDNERDGKDYENGASHTGGQGNYSGSHPPRGMFKGVQATFSTESNPVGGRSGVFFVHVGDGTGLLEFYGARKINWNGSGEINYPEGWHPVPGNKVTSYGVNPGFFSGFRWNGKLVVAYTGCSYDASGNGNHFWDNDQALHGYTQGGKARWSASFKGNKNDGLNLFSSGNGGFSASEMDGYDTVRTWELPQSEWITDVRSAAVYGQSHNEQNSDVMDGRKWLRVNGSAELAPAGRFVTGSQWHNITGLCGGTLKKIELRGLGNNKGGASLGAIMVNGRRLLDPGWNCSYSGDPMRQFVTLKTPRGNAKIVKGGTILEATGTGNASASSNAMDKSKHFYYEMLVSSSTSDTGTGVSIGWSPATPGAPQAGLFALYAKSGKWLAFNGDVGETDSGISPAGQDIVGVAVNTTIGRIDFFVNGAAAGIVTYDVAATADRPLYIEALGKSNAAIRQMYNFGTHPFGASNVTHNIEIGEVQITGLGTFYAGFVELEVTEYTVSFSSDKNLSSMKPGDTMEGQVGFKRAAPFDIDPAAGTMSFEKDPGFMTGESLMDKTIGQVAPSKPDHPDADPADYTEFETSEDDSSNLTTYSFTAAQDKAYFSRVKYKDDSGTPIESEFSPWNRISTDVP